MATNSNWFKYSYNDNLVTDRSHASIMLVINREQGEYHRDVTLPKHFQTGNSNRYHYVKRSARWLKYKLAKYKEVLPDDVASGELRETVKTSKVTKTQYSFRVYCKAPFALNAERRKEVEQVLVKEHDEYCRAMRQKYLKLAKSPQYARKRGKRGP